MEQLVELILWEQVQLEYKYPKEDNNNGYTYGLNLLDNGDIIDVQWFESDQERFDYIKNNNLKLTT
jgi:hypothetical protein